MISFLEEHINLKLPHIPKVKVPKLNLIKYHSLDMQYFAIFLRYGSLTSDERVRVTSGQIKDLIGMKKSTQFNIFYRWKRYGYKLHK